MHAIRLLGKSILLCVLLLVFNQGTDCRAQENATPIEDSNAKISAPAKAGPSFFKPMINAELSFVQLVCEANDDQMKAIVAAAKDAHKAMAELVSVNKRFGNDPFGHDPNEIAKIKFVGPNGQWILANPYQRVRDDMTKLLKPLVTEQQYARYVAETREREQYEREAAIGILINALDINLALSAEQREQLHEILSKESKDLDLHWLDVYYMNTTSIPPMPDHLFVSILSTSQRERLCAQHRENVFASVHNEKPAEFNDGWLEK